MREEKFYDVVHEVERLFDRLKDDVTVDVIENSSHSIIIKKFGGYTYSQTRYNNSKKFRNNFKLCDTIILEIVVEYGIIDSFKFDAGLFKEMKAFVAKYESKKELQNGN